MGMVVQDHQSSLSKRVPFATMQNREILGLPLVGKGPQHMQIGSSGCIVHT